MKNLVLSMVCIAVWLATGIYLIGLMIALAISGVIEFVKGE